MAWSDREEQRYQELNKHFSKHKNKREDPFYLEYITLGMKRKRIQVYNEMDD